MTTYYLSRYALSKGILMVTGEPGSLKSLIRVDGYGYQRVGTDVHLTRLAATKRANGMRDAKIRSLKEQLRKLVNLKTY